MTDNKPRSIRWLLRSLTKTLGQKEIEYLGDVTKQFGIPDCCCHRTADDILHRTKVVPTVNADTLDPFGPKSSPDIGTNYSQTCGSPVFGMSQSNCEYECCPQNGAAVLTLLGPQSGVGDTSLGISNEWFVPYSGLTAVLKGSKELPGTY